MVCGTQTISPYILRTVTHVPRHSNCFTCDADNVSEIRINHQPHLHKTLQMTTDTPPVTEPIANPMVCGTQTISPYIPRTLTHVPRHSNFFTCDADNVSEIRINHQPYLHKTLQMTTDTSPVTNPWSVAHRPFHRTSRDFDSRTTSLQLFHMRSR